MSDIQHTWDDIVANGTASMMVIRCEEMPNILGAAIQGEPDARMRMAAVENVLGEILADKHTCLFCSKTTNTPDLAVLAFVAKEIEPGHNALFALVCNECDEREPDKLVKKIGDALGFKRLFHEAGRA